MTRFKGLPHWCMTGTRPAFYDTESATTIEMVAKLYGSYTELVEDYNKYVDEINKAILEFETGVISDTTTFKETITKIVHDYIKMIDDKVKIQDDTIAEAVDYMKTNIIYAITETVNEMKESGELAELVVEGFNDAIARITSLETTLASVDAKAEQNIDDILDLKGRVKTAENTVSGMESKVNQSTYAVDSMSKEVSGVKGDLSTLSGEVSAVKTTNTNINRTLTTLSGRVDDNEVGIIALEGRVEALETSGVPGGGGTLPEGVGYIIETGSNANGEWIKFSDGTMIVTQTFDRTAGTTQQTGALYWCKIIDFVEYPVAFTSVQAVNIQVRHTDIVSTTPSGRPNNKCCAALYCYTAVSTINGAMTIGVTTIGKWK